MEFVSILGDVKEFWKMLKEECNFTGFTPRCLLPGVSFPVHTF